MRVLRKMLLLGKWCKLGRDTLCGVGMMLWVCCQCWPLREATSAAATSSNKRSLTSQSCSMAHSYASRSTASVNGCQCAASARMMLATRAIAVRVASSISCEQA